MKEFLRNLGIVDTLRIELPVQKAEFVRILRDNVDVGGGFFEAFSSSKNVFKGSVDLQGFELKKRRRMFARRHNMATATGKFSQLGETLRIDTEVNGFHWSMYVYYFFVTAFYAIFLGVFLFTDSFSGDNAPPAFMAVFLILHAALMFTIPYFLMKSGVKQMKHDLERELYFLAQKKTNLEV